MEVLSKHSICRDIFKAIHEGKWLTIEYKNRNEQITKYWIGIKNINPRKRTLDVDGLHLGEYSVAHLQMIFIDSILSSSIIEGSYCKKNETLINDIYLNPEKYKNLFENTANLKILNYLEDCNKMDVAPYKSDFKLIKRLDLDSFYGRCIELSDGQFKDIVDNFQFKATKATDDRKIQQLAINVLSINTPKGLYVLAYKRLELDVKERALIASKEITLCKEFCIDESRESIRKYLDADDYLMLEDFEEYAEQIKDAIQKNHVGVDDMPYVIGLGIDLVVDLKKEYKAIIDMYQNGTVTDPIRAFFGELTKRPQRRKEYPLALLNKRINMDQLLAINNAMKYPNAYIQGPPGTGKTNTIINTISTAFFNDKTVLFVSYNNHPIDGVYKKLKRIEYKNKELILFPIIRLGNNEVVKQTLSDLREWYNKAKGITVYSKTLDKRREDRIKRAERLSTLLKKYETILDYKERRETIDTMMQHERKTKGDMSAIIWSLEGQMSNINNALDSMGMIGDNEFMELLDDNYDEFITYMYYMSAKYIQEMNKKCKGLIEILEEKYGDEEQRVTAFNKFLSSPDNVRKFIKVFPVVATTCISAHKIGAPEPYFDMVIMDEASQCNIATALIPIIRGKSLMLVGDPQQLNPVILLDETTNTALKKKYFITNEYDYRANSIYKAFLSCDSVSDEVLLRNHYRCNKRIIDFNNKKYYNGKLKVCSTSEEKNPLVFYDVGEVHSQEKNTSPNEVEMLIDYCNGNKDKSIGIITPFTNQKKLIESEFKIHNLPDVSVGTVHAFQGDEKDIILFSTAITSDTGKGTYDWLKNNKELINVATSRAKHKLVILSSMKAVENLCSKDEQDDLYELINYARHNGDYKVTQKKAMSRALGVKPFSTATEEAFLENLSHALDNIGMTQNKCVVKKEVSISQVFEDNLTCCDLFYSGRFDFVVYQVINKKEIPVLAIELDGKEHYEDEVVKERDRKKNLICKVHNMELIRIDNTYARRYNHIKGILTSYFNGMK